MEFLISVRWNPYINTVKPVYNDQGCHVKNAKFDQLLWYSPYKACFILHAINDYPSKTTTFTDGRFRGVSLYQYDPSSVRLHSPKSTMSM